MTRKFPGNIWKKLAHGYRQFAADKPGQRFCKAHQRWKGGRHPLLVNIAFIVAGLILFVLGILLGLVPGVPGIVLGVLGIALIGTRFHRMAVWLDWTEIKCRKLGQRLKRDRRGISKALRNAPPLPP